MDMQTTTTGHTVTATWKGERVYLGTQVFPAKELITLNLEPVSHDPAAAERIAGLAAADESLSEIRVESV